jgi:hypothetical protein
MIAAIGHADRWRGAESEGVMRTRARERGLLLVLLRSRCVLGACAAAVAVASAWVEIGGQSLGGRIGGLLVSPADARREAPRQPRGFGAGLPRPPHPLPFPALAPPTPSPQFAAFQPTTKPVPFGSSGSPLPSRSGAAVGGRPAVAHPVRPPRGDKVGGRDADAPMLIPRVPAAKGGWDALVKPSTVQGMLPQPRPLVASAPSRPAGKTTVRPSFRGLVDKLSGGTSKPVPTRPAAKPRPRAASSGAGVKSPRRPLGGRWIGELLPPIGTFRPREVLGINLSAAALAKARQAKYELVERVELPELGVVIDRLRPPETLNAVTGRERLFELLPENGFVLNRVYAPYRLGGRQGPGVGVASTSGRGCAAERCFGSGLINWRPRLADCARDVKIGIVDTGFDKSHPAFAGLRYEYREFLPDGSARAPDQHGTGVLSLLAGNSASGTPGLIPDAAYVIANAFFTDADGQPVSDTAQMLLALNWLKRSGVSVVNLSFAGPEDELMHHAVQELTKAGVVVVAAAGNEGPAAPPSYPAAYPEVIAVTAVDRNLAAYRYAGRGMHIDVAAPGVDVWTAIPGRREGPQTGTSFAVPYVTAVVAVALPEAGLAPDGNALAAKRRALALLRGNVKGLGEEGDDPTFGAGLVQAPASCGPPAPVAVANATPAAQPWAGTVQRTRDPAPAEPPAVGAWVSTVHTASEGPAR